MCRSLYLNFIRLLSITLCHFYITANLKIRHPFPSFPRSRRSQNPSKNLEGWKLVPTAWGRGKEKQWPLCTEVWWIRWPRRAVRRRSLRLGQFTTSMTGCTLHAMKTRTRPWNLSRTIRGTSTSATTCRRCAMNPSLSPPCPGTPACRIGIPLVSEQYPVAPRSFSAET